MPEVPTSRVISDEDISREQRLRIECLFIAATYRAGTAVKSADVIRSAEALLPYARDGVVPPK
jgi:hypothetical protein